MCSVRRAGCRADARESNPALPNSVYVGSGVGGSGGTDSKSGGEQATRACCCLRRCRYCSWYCCCCRCRGFSVAYSRVCVQETIKSSFTELPLPAVRRYVTVIVTSNSSVCVSPERRCIGRGRQDGCVVGKHCRCQSSPVRFVLLHIGLYKRVKRCAVDLCVALRCSASKHTLTNRLRTRLLSST